MKIGLDIDGVIANFYYAMCKRYNRHYTIINRWKKDWIDDVFHEIENDESFWKTIPVLTHPESIDFRVEAYISSFPQQMQHARELWLRRNRFPEAPLICAPQNKVDILKDLSIDVFIDDRMKNVVEVNDAGILCLKYVPYYLKEDRYNDHDITHLSEVNERLARIKRV